ncbi:MAG: hypothetical protein VZQ62_00460 [Methanosphaera sp.]|nr:hypothetical protein [Methanosphaera sp.]
MKIISNKEMLDYIEGKINLDYDLLLTYHKDTNIWVACDNRTDNKWVEEFKDLKSAINWLKGEFEL